MLFVVDYRPVYITYNYFCSPNNTAWFHTGVAFKCPTLSSQRQNTCFISTAE